MMRLQRIGRRNNPSYRVVITDKRTGPKSNKHVAIVGSYDPKINHIKFNGEQVKYWLSQGVKTSSTVHNLLISERLINGSKINVLPRKSPIINETKEADKASEDTVEESSDSADTVKEETADTDDGNNQSEVMETEPAVETVVEKP